MEVALIGLCTAIPIAGLINLYKFKFRDRDCIALDKLNTGDIIYISHNLSRLTHNIVNIEFSHIGMVYRADDGTLYFVELTPPGDNSKSSGQPGIYPFLERYAHYNGYFCVRKCKETISRYQFLSAFNQLAICGISFDYSFTGHFLQSRMGIKRDILKRNEEGFYEYCCSEFVYLMICNLGLIEFDENDFHDSFRFLCSDKIDEVYGPIYDIDDDCRDKVQREGH